MLKHTFFILCLLVGATSARAQDGRVTWNSMAVFVGKTTDTGTQARTNTYLARIETRQADGSGYYEVWTDSQPFHSETFASQIAREFRTACNATHSNACVRDQQPAWNERLDKVIFVH